MLEVPKLNLGSIDAVNYTMPANKSFFNKILFREDYLKQVLLPEKYFLIGEKGTGKTSYAVFLDNSDYAKTKSKVISLTQTDYQRFVKLSEQGKFSVSNFVDIWKVILLLLVAESICEKFPNRYLGFPLFNALKQAVDEYYSSSFRPEVDQSLDVVENSEAALKLMLKYAEISAKEGSSFQRTFTNVQVNLASLEKQFRKSIESLKLGDNFILFIDGIDIRPDKIDFSNYIECIKGLANAAWQLNTEFFRNTKDRKNSSMKIMLLMRPDILDSVGFQNLNAKVRDNGIVLDWMTSCDTFRSSKLFRMIVGVLAKQQDLTDYNPVTVWKQYFPYELENSRVQGKEDDPFIGLLRYSFYRPRDIMQYLQLMQSYVKEKSANKIYFSREAFRACQKDHSDYLLGEVRDYLGFYYSTADFDEVIGFFSEFGGSGDFSYEEFKEAFNRHKMRLKDRAITIAELKGEADDFLQFLYALNIVGYIESTEEFGYFVHYSFRDRTTVRLRPKVRYGLKYQVHPGLQRSLLVGTRPPAAVSRRRLQPSKSSQK